ncbi:hypothetical protein G6F57_011845 [Rhizopus arrhizus]|nr:hypothetical protein G6F23_008755 [Rhizopus arrhizus]KAG0806344.1 hypothetical protein G6F20_011196 [Rhizopus arrhizus]KAG0848973.1 hypothetical protein G6F17_011176 [Rhizopus arrhizus]KAG0863678.1 hypothetical protein G6F16_011617 [Rhizopus arrhizus]KAG0872002.1 hypothetical protein G6F15_011245 [Rhizopus arrhizus]
MNDILQLSFEKLESLDINKSGLSSFVLIRNSIIHLFNKQDNIIKDYAIEQEEQIWLDNCIHELEQDEEDEDEEMPLSPPPQSENTIDFIQKDIYYQPYPIPYF